MATQTTTLHLNKPAYTEAADIAVVNGNMDTIDTWATSTNQSIGNLSNLTTTEKGSLVGAANELNSKIETLKTNTPVNRGKSFTSANQTVSFDTKAMTAYLIIVHKQAGSSNDGWSGIYAYSTDGIRYLLNEIMLKKSTDDAKYGFTVTATTNSIIIQNGEYGGICISRVIALNELVSF